MYILERHLKREKKLVNELSKVYGIGIFLSEKICIKYGLNKEVKVGDVRRSVLLKMSRLISRDFEINIGLYNKLRERIGKERAIRSYKGYRRYLKLPLNGQRTKTNRKTVKKLL